MAVIQNVNLASGDIISLSNESYITSTMNAADVLYWINNNQVMPQYKISILFADETINYELPAEDILLSGSYSENYQNGQRRSFSFSLYNSDGKYTPGINSLWAGTRVRVDCGVQLPDNSTVWFQKGVFVIKSLQPSLSNEQQVVQVSLADKFSLFEDNTGMLEMSYEINEGENISNIIKSILKTDSGNSFILDPKEPIIHASLQNKTTQIKISKSAGESLGSILLELATQMSAEMFYNAEGNLTVIPTNEVSNDINKPILTNYIFENGEFSNLDFSYDLSTVVNRIIVIGSSVNGGVYRAVAENNDPTSPVSCKRIGYHTGNIINDSNITNDILAQERASYELRSQLVLKTSVNLTVLFNPFLSVNNIIGITCDFFDLNNAKFLIQSVSWSMDYGGTMSITASNLNNIPSLTR